MKLDDFSGQRAEMAIIKETRKNFGYQRTKSYKDNKSATYTISDKKSQGKGMEPEPINNKPVDEVKVVEVCKDRMERLTKMAGSEEAEIPASHQRNITEPEHEERTRHDENRSGKPWSGRPG